MVCLLCFASFSMYSLAFLTDDSVTHILPINVSSSTSLYSILSLDDSCRHLREWKQKYILILSFPFLDPSRRLVWFATWGLLWSCATQPQPSACVTQMKAREIPTRGLDWRSCHRLTHVSYRLPHNTARKTRVTRRLVVLG